MPFGLVNRLEKAACRIQSCGLDKLAKPGKIQDLLLETLSEIKIALDACRWLPRDESVAKLKSVSSKMVELHLSAWFAHIPGSGDGDPEAAPRLIIIVDKSNIRHDIIEMTDMFSVLPHEESEII